MSIEIVLEGKINDEMDKEGLRQLLEQMAKDKKLRFDDYGEVLQMEICPEGFIECSFENEFVSIACQSNVAGPGLHAYVAKLYDEIVSASKIEFSVGDASNYYFDRNFDKLKKFFYQWLDEIAAYMNEVDVDQHNLFIAWPLNYYRPLERDGYIVTPMGYVSLQDFKEKSGEELAKNFFIWNEEKQDAHYYLNCAINLLWKECYFEYSSMNEKSDKYAQLILDYLEIAHKLDKSLPLPMDIYDMLCEVTQREPFIEEGRDMPLPDIGYRRNDVFYNFGNWSILAPGVCEKDIDTTSDALILTAPYRHDDEPWSWVLRATAYEFNKEIEGFIEVFEAPDDTSIESFSFEDDGVEVRGTLSEYDGYYAVEAQLNKGTDMMLVSISINSLKLKDMAISMIHDIRNEHIEDTAEKN